MNSLKKKLMRNKTIYLTLRYVRYIILRYIIRRYFHSYYLSLKNSVIKVIQEKGNSFFGYYNISPENTNHELVYLSVDNEFERGSLFEPAIIKYKSSKGDIKQIGITKAWNWQQGCMLQWFPSNDDYIIYNDYDELIDKYVSRVIDKKGKLIKTYSIPVNNICNSGNYALSLNYDRLAKLRPDYGYFNKPNFSILQDDSKDGIWYLDLKNGHKKLIITLEKLKKLSPSDTMERAIHKVNHIDINPSGTRFIFLHRWFSNGIKYTRLISSEPDGSELFVLNGDKMTSHCCWENDTHIISYCFIKNKGVGYYRFKDLSNNVLLLSNKLSKKDGHPSVSKDGEWLLIDTYPDKSRFSNIYLYNFKKDNIVNIGSFYQSYKYMGEMRIDLHPKWSFDKSIFFESGHLGKRKLFKIHF